MTTWLQAGFKLFFFVILLPFFVTLFHLNHAQERAHLLFVGPVTSHLQAKSSGIKSNTSFNDLYGMYHGISSEKDKPPSVFSKVLSLPAWHVHWPSIAHVSTLLATPTSTLLTRHSMNTNSDMISAQIVYDTLQNKWCVQSPSHQVCSTKVEDVTTLSCGIWSDESISIQVLYRGGTRETAASFSMAAHDATIPQKFRRNPNKRTRANRNLQQLLERPATSLLIAVNVILAFVYWNRGTSPSSVAKIYSKIVNDGEYWRSFTGATAHFEPLHLGFNMMALYSLGTELEPSYGSIPFLLYNISLVPITTCIMMSLVYLQMRYTGNSALSETSTVGYSGVLFCWMVITSLERQETCPIPFMPGVCFATHQFGAFRFNISPIVQLFVAQAIMRRVSFVGHLAGIVAGFLLHWNLLPLELVQPQVLIPGMYLILLWRARNVIPVTPRQEEECDDDNCLSRVETPPSSGRLDGRRIKRERDQAMHKLLVWVRAALVVNVVLSVLVFDALGGTFLAPFLGLVYFQFCVQSHTLLLACSRDSTDYDIEKTRLATLWKGFILSCVLTLVCDSMSCAGWIVSSIYWQSDSGAAVGLVPACVFLVFRLAIQVMALVAASKNLSDIGETGGGLFVVVFGSTVLENARIMGTALFSRITMNNWTAFEGQGIPLGGSSDGASTEVV